MTAFTVNAGGTVAWDSLSGGSTNATLDTYTVSNNTTLLIDTDSYQCAGHSTAFGSLDTVTPSGTGGKLMIDSRAVRVIPFNTGSSTVPAIGTSITQGGVSSYLLGVWADWLSEPLAAGAAMPASGYIKVKNKTGGNYAAGALGGISASATGADTTGWIEVRGADTAVITTSRVFPFEAVGDWFEIGTTNGSRGQVIPFPTCATVAGTFPGWQVETGSGTGIYEWWQSVGSLPASSTIATDAVRGKVLWHTTAGVRIGSDGTNNVGYLPASGCRVRIPGVILTTCTRTGSGSGARVLPNATNSDGGSTRQEWSSSNGGVVTLSKAVSQWGNYWSTAAQVNILDAALSDKISLYRHTGPLNIQRSCVAPTQNQTGFALNILSAQAGGVVTDNVFARRDNSTGYVAQVQYVNGVAWSGNKWCLTGARSNGSYGTVTHTASNDCTWDDEVLIGGRFLIQTSANATINATQYVDNVTGTTTTSNTMQCFWVDRVSNITIDGITLPVTDNHPYGPISVIYGVSGLKLRGLGSRASMLSLGSANQSAYLLESGSNNQGVTLQRCYVNNTRSALLSTNPSDSGVVFESVFGDFGDTAYYQGQNMLFKGCGYGTHSAAFGSVYGSVWADHFTSATAGRVIALCNEPTTASGSQIAATAGTPRFDSAGNVLMPTVGDQVTWEMSYRAIGHTALANVSPTLGGVNTGNITFEFAIDTGSGFGSYLSLTAGNLSAQSIDPADGFRLRFRATTATANASNAVQSIRIDTVSTLTAQTDNLYPIDLATLTIAANVSLSGAEIRIYDLDGSPAGSLGTELAGTESNSGATFAFSGEAGNSVWVQIMLAGYVEYGLETTIPSGGGTFTAQLQIDLND